MLFEPTYYEPFGEFRRLQREINRLFDGVGVDADEFPAVNVWSNADGIVVNAELPGVESKDINISINQDVLTIEGERKTQELSEGVVCHRSERGEGRFVRSIKLPFEVDADKVKAQCKLGVLTVTMPRAETSKPRKIAISAE